MAADPRPSFHRVVLVEGIHAMHSLRGPFHLHRQRGRRPNVRPLLERWLHQMDGLNMNDTFRGDTAHLIRCIKALLESTAVHFEEIEVPA